MWVNPDLKNLEVVTAETVNSKVEFDSPFRIVGQLSDGRTVIENPLAGVHAPDVTLYVDKEGSGVGEEEIDNVAWNEPQETWEAVNGYSGQQGYRGPCMHVSEFLGGSMAHHALADVGAVYVVTTVECSPMWEATEEEDQEVRDNPAGWMLLKLKD